MKRQPTGEDIFLGAKKKYWSPLSDRKDAEILKLWSEDGDLSGNYDLCLLFANILRDFNAVLVIILAFADDFISQLWFGPIIEPFAVGLLDRKICKENK